MKRASGYRAFRGPVGIAADAKVKVIDRHASRLRRMHSAAPAMNSPTEAGSGTGEVLVNWKLENI